MADPKSSKSPPSENHPHLPLEERGAADRLAIGKLIFSPLNDKEQPPSRNLNHLADKERGSLQNLEVEVEVRLGSTSLTIKELSKLQEGSLLSLDQLETEAVGIFVNGKKVASGEVVTVEGFYGVKIIAFEKNAHF